MNKTIPWPVSFKLDIKCPGMPEGACNYASQAVSDEVGDGCPLRYYRKGTDIAAACEPLVIILGIKKLERCCRIKWDI